MKKTTSKRKRVSKKTAAKKKSELDKLSLMDGKLEIDKVRELEELLGVDQTNVFKTNDLDVFKDDLSEMTLTDMQALAVEAGVFPAGNRSALKQKLLKEFVSQTKGRRYATGEQKPIVDPSDPKFEQVKKLMSEGF
tara:strand:+ start:11340 stop:11747 length:408 start_codon:yes stop_codon:yes gene_type:complete